METDTSIAGVVLTLNEEKNILRSLQSLNWCQELVVLDSGSTDRTQEIAESYGATVYKHIQSPPFQITEQRNWALTNCRLKSQWVLFLDADEEIGIQLRKDIRDSIRSVSNSRVNSFELAPRYWFLGTWLKRTQAFPSWHPRLVKRGEVFFTGGVWESFSENAITQKIYTPYEHYAFSKGVESWILAHLRYASWDAQCITQYHETQLSSSFNTSRKLPLRIWSSRIWPLRPVSRFFQKYLLNLGFLDGWQSLVFALLMSFYELIVVLMVIERKNYTKNQ